MKAEMQRLAADVTALRAELDAVKRELGLGPAPEATDAH
jgi:hypothetical protein